MAYILEGWTRGEVARRASVSIQTIRDWVIHFNDEGHEGLIDRKSTGRPPKLTLKQQEVVKDILQEGAGPGKSMVLCGGAVKILRKLSKPSLALTLMSAMLGVFFVVRAFPILVLAHSHPKQKPERIEGFKKNSLTIWQKS